MIDPAGVPREAMKVDQTAAAAPTAPTARRAIAAPSYSGPAGAGAPAPTAPSAAPAESAAAVSLSIVQAASTAASSAPAPAPIAAPIPSPAPAPAQLEAPQLQSFEEILQMREQYVGPTDESNWVMPGWLLVGAYPASVNDEENYSLLSSILVQGVSMFVCLQKEYQATGVTEEMWRHGMALRPYYESALEVAGLLRADENLAKQNVQITADVKFIHFPIEDCSVGDDDAVTALAAQLVDHLLHGETIYLHCWGGHGRTGTLVCIMLHMMYEMEAIDAMRRCQFVHDLRRIPIQVGSPQTQAQRNQVSQPFDEWDASFETADTTTTQLQTQLPVLSRPPSSHRYRSAEWSES
jgi:hypothetical protein